MYNEQWLDEPTVHKQNYVQFVSKSISFEMELQISRNHCTKEKKKCNLWKNQGTARKNDARAGGA